VFSAHLDTVFPENTNVKVTREGNVLRGPGIGDDCRGLAVLLAVVRAMDKASVTTPGTITFVGTVGEEGLGDLRGVKALFNETLKGQIDRFVSVDGTGLGISHIAVGSHRYRVTFKGPGGHSYGAFGIANPVHALGRAIAGMADLQVPSDPKTTFNIGRVGGGTSVNAIAFEAWMEVDMRSADAASLQAVDARFHKAVDEAVVAENARWNDRGRVTVDKQLVGDRPAGRTEERSPIVAAALSVSRALGLTSLLDEGSTDANLAISLGIPAITVDGGGRGTGSHSLEEAFDTTDSWRGTQRAVLLAIALAQS
jgi:acetylornithine deacetylase/succinyl-diaminopimelate desuccinylase-like protein